jgi:outer membrane protein TolC
METLLESAKHGLVKHKETYDYLLTVLKETIGIGEGESLDLEPLADFQELEESAAQYLDRARHHDPVYQLQELKVKEKQFEKRMLQADRFPKISLTAKWDQLRDVYANTNRGMVGIVGKWDIWDFGRLGSQIEAKSHEIEEMKWQGEIEIREHENAIRRIFHEARAAREKIKLTETLIQERQEIYKNEKTRLIAGEKGLQELVDSFVALEEAKTQRLQAITEYRILIVQLERKIGFEAHLEELNGSEDFDPSPNSREAES